MTTLTAIRARVRTTLGESSAALWTDAQLDEAIDATVGEYSLVVGGKEASTMAAVSSGATATPTPTAALAVTRVTLATGDIVPKRGRNLAGSRADWERQSWELHGSTIHLTRALDAQTLTIWYRDHYVDTTEIPDAHDEIIVAGGVVRALEMRSISDLRRQGVLQKQRHGFTVMDQRRRYDGMLDALRRRMRVH